MRNNQPVTRKEYQLNEEDFLISRTDLKGRIEYANASFVEVSGFTADELEGSPHNIVRHPDMPPEAFANLWETIRSGETWVGLVKNRRKDGGFYWVKAHVSGIREDGELRGFVSVRTRAEAQAIARAERDYALIRQGQGKHLYLDRGEVKRRGFLARLARMDLRSVTARVNAMAALAIVLLLVSAGMNVEAETVSGGALSLQLLLAMFGSGLIAVMAWHVGHAIRKPLQQARDFSLQIAAGNLVSRMESKRRDEMGRLIEVLNVMRKGLLRIAQDVDHGVAIVTPASHRIAVSTQELASRTEQQAAFLQQTVASMEQIMAAVQQNAGNAEEANHLATSTAETVEKSGRVMREVVDTMGRITGSASEMSEIIDVIDSIAFQTNILALNASVEAARAGEQGRGFAVVADEVRSLAGRSAEAANQVRALIDRSSQEIGQGASLIQQAESSIDDVVDAVNRVKVFITDIAQASSQQSVGVQEINQAMSQMDVVTSENASRVQQSAGSASVMDEEIRKLAHSVAVFRLDSTPHKEPSGGSSRESHRPSRRKVSHRVREEVSA